MKSVMFHMIDGSLISQLAKHVLDKLILSPTNSEHGMRVTVQANRFKKPYRSLVRPGVVQTHFGKTRWCDNDISIRSTYEYVHRHKAMRTDPFNSVTKPFCDRLSMMSTIIFHLLNEKIYI